MLSEDERSDESEGDGPPSISHSPSASEAEGLFLRPFGAGPGFWRHACDYSWLIVLTSLASWAVRGARGGRDDQQPSQTSTVCCRPRAASHARCISGSCAPPPSVKRDGYWRLASTDGWTQRGLCEAKRAGATATTRGPEKCSRGRNARDWLWPKRKLPMFSLLIGQKEH
jgi:hypothetical protein